MRLLRMLPALVLLAAACSDVGNVEGTTSSTAPATTAAPTAALSTATEAEPPGWPAEVGRLCLLLEQSYLEGDPSGGPLTLGEEVRLALEASGLEVRIGEGAGCEATLTVSLFLRPAEKWTGVVLGGGQAYCYAGASIAGNAILSAEGQEALSLRVEGLIEPSGAFIPCGRLDYEELPFAAAWAGALSDLQERWWWEAGAEPPQETFPDAEALVTGPASDRAPAWSPAGMQIAFVSDRDGNSEIYLLSGEEMQVSRLTEDPAADASPAWSPDGSRLAFASDRSGNWDIYVTAADGSGTTRLTDDPADDFDPAWSPDGTRIAFTSERDGNRDVYAMAADGSDAVRLTDDPASDFAPAWSADGTRLAFTSSRDGNWEIYLMAADGSDAVRLTDDPASDFAPAWSPDGTRIAFSSDRAGVYDLWLLSPDGWGLQRVTDDPAADWEPSWSPEGNRLVFTCGEQDDLCVVALPD